MAFLETPVFPPRAGAGATFTLRNSVETTPTASGYEVRNLNWAQTLREYQISLQMPSAALMREIRDHYMAVGGTAHGFRIRDLDDYSASQTEGYLGKSATGSASLTYQLHKYYPTGALSEFRQIRKLVAGITVYRAGTPATVGTGVNQYTVDLNTGIVTWGAGSSVNGIALAWAGEFDTPVRYSSQISINVAAPAVFQAPNVTLVEIRV